MLIVSLGGLAGTVAAEPVANTQNFCTKRSGSIPSGTVPAGQLQVIFGPYRVSCGTTSHHFNVRGASGQLPVIVQQHRGGNWSSVTTPGYSPSGHYGAGTFRLVLDNSRGRSSVSYTGSFTVPM